MFATDRISSRLILAIFLLFPSAALVAQRLPDVASPQHYTLQLAPDLQAATFTGQETIDLTLAQAANSIVLNAWQLKFDVGYRRDRTVRICPRTCRLILACSRLRFTLRDSCLPGQ